MTQRATNQYADGTRQVFGSGVKTLSEGIGVNYDPGEYPFRAQLFVDTQGIFVFNVAGDAWFHEYIKYGVSTLAASGVVSFETGAGASFQVNCGGNFDIRDIDADKVTRLTIDSSASPGTGRLQIPEDASNSITLGVSADAKLGFDGSNLVITVTGGGVSARVAPRVVSWSSGATITINADATDHYNAVGLTAATTFAVPSGTPTDGQKLTIRIKDDGTGRGLTWNAIFRAIGATLPVTTTAGKLIYVGLVYNSTDTKWDAVAVAEEA